MRDRIIQALEGTVSKRLSRNTLWLQIPGLNGRPSDDYWSAEQALVDEGRIERRRGRNGGIQLVPLPQVQPAPAAAPQQAADLLEQDREIDQYGPILQQILENWTEQPGFTHVFGAITGLQGRRPTGGRWSRPDIVLCTVSDWLFSSRPEGDVR